MAFEQYTNTKDYSVNYTQKDIEDNNILALFSYIGPLFLVPLFGAKESPYAQFHCNQGLVLFIAIVAYQIATGFVTKLVSIFSWAIGSVFNLVFSLGNFVFLALAILGIYNAYKGFAKELPLIGKIRILK